MQRAILDGVNVINFSISGGSNPFGDAVEMAFLDAYNAGVFVAASAGNAGPGANTVDHRGPWTTTVASATSDGTATATLTVAGTPTALTLVGQSITPTGVPVAAEVVINTGDLLCQSPAPAGTFAGKIVVCRRGVNDRVAKSANVAAGGAVGMVLYNPYPSRSTSTSTRCQPSTCRTMKGPPSWRSSAPTRARRRYVAGRARHASWRCAGEFQLAGRVGHDARRPEARHHGARRRDPCGLHGDGVRLAHRYVRPPERHLDGEPAHRGRGGPAKAKYPTWTPGQIKSALMTTSRTGVLKEDGVTPATPFDIGAGRADLATAMAPGLTFSATGADLVSLAGNLSVANQPSIYLPSNPGKISLVRSAQSMLAVNKTWRITAVADPGLVITVPSLFFVPAGRAASLVIALDVSLVPVGATRHGRLSMVTTDGTHRATLPISVVRRDGGTVISQTCDATSFSVGQTTNCAVSVTNTTFAPQTVAVGIACPPESPWPA